MKVKNIMKPWQGDLTVQNGLKQNQDLYSLSLAEITSYTDIVDIVDEQQKKVGEVKRRILEYLCSISQSELFYQIIDKFEEGVVAIDHEGVIFYANEMYSEILGVPTGKIIGRKMQKIEPGAAILDVLENKSETVLERQYIKTIGKYVSGKVSPLFSNDILCGAVSFFIDATKIEELSQEIKRANKIVFNLEQQMLAQEELNKNEIIGKNPDLLTTVYQASIVAKVDVPVMIRGENGVGKEIIAKFIHRCSSRAHKPLITVNCAAIPENLIESELFGYEEGSFTGAKRGGKVGKFEMADGGTLFLDEIGDMPLNMQTKLLRAIQESEIEKVGSSNNVSVDVRIITATNQPLEEMIEKKLFRKDLYYRINTVSLTIPPVRDRKEDIVLLADYFLKKFNKKYNKSVMFSNDVLAFFSSYSWPGNVRELKNCIEYGVIMCQNNRFDKTYLSQHMQDEKIEPQAAFIEETVPPFTERTLKEALDMVEKNVIQDTLAACGNNKAEAMRMLGLSRRTFYRHLQKHNINTK